MAFTTIEGTGGAPWTFQGTAEVDEIAVITGDRTDSVAYDFLAEGYESDDTINWNGVRSVTIRGGQGNDVITNNVAIGAGDSDIITTSFINGNDGNDVIGNSQFGLAATISTISGGQADDTIYAGELQTSRINGNLGDDTINFVPNNFVNDEGNQDRINWANSSVFGGQGNDTINVIGVASSITDTNIAGQDGDDTINISWTGGFGTGTTIAGGDGDDLIDAALDNNPETTVALNVYGDAGNDDITTGTGADTISAGEGDDVVSGRQGDDSITGDAGNDALNGDGGADTIDGGEGNDTIDGGNGADVLTAGNGDDVITGGAGADVMSGGTETNRFDQERNSTDALTFVNAGAPATARSFLDDGDRFIVNADVITDWALSAGSNFIDTGSDYVNQLAAGTAGASQMSYGIQLNNAQSRNQNVAIRGTFLDGGDGADTFLVDRAGADIAIFTTYDDRLREGQNATFTNFVVLQNAQAATISASQFQQV